MSNRWFRFGIALLALGAAAAAGYRIFEQEQRLTQHVNSVRSSDRAAETALGTVSDLKASLHAYDAEGQGDAFWTARAAALSDRLRGSILEQEAPAAAAGFAVTVTLDLIARLAATEQRARELVRAREKLLAGEVVFVESRDLLDAIRLQVSAARSGVMQSADSALANGRRQQALLALGAGGILAFATLLLVIPGRATSEADRPAQPISAEPDPAQAATAGTITARGAPAGSTAAALTPASDPVIGRLTLKEAAAICTDLGRVSQSIEISALLDRAGHVLKASGVVVWMASADGRDLYPVASAGYDDRLLARIGSIPRNAANVTAGALREAAPRTSAGVGSAAAALAVPLMTPIGPVGVLSAEMRDIVEVNDTQLAVATIFAAQLAALLGSIATATGASSEPPQDDTAQAAKKVQA
jgi:hypothetical protein